MGHLPLNDITDRIPEPPKWWVEGIPRYCEYHPHHNIDHPTQALVSIRCTGGCGQRFNVVFGFGGSTQKNLANDEVWKQVEEFDDEPPFHFVNGYNCQGNNSVADVEDILQVWQRERVGPYGWLRQEQLEGEVDWD